MYLYGWKYWSSNLRYYSGALMEGLRKIREEMPLGEQLVSAPVFGLGSEEYEAGILRT
jgi:hypothetical protein